MTIPKLSAQQKIVNPDGTPSSLFLRFMEETRIGQETIDAAQDQIIADLAAAVADIAQAQLDIIATQDDLQDQVDRLTAILAGTGETFTGISVGGVDMKPLLDRSDGSRFDDVTALPANAVTVSGTRDDLTLTAQGTGGVPPYTNTEIVISAHTFRLGSSAISLSGATVTGLSVGPTLRYYVYYDDPTFAGGAVTYVATQSIPDLTGTPGRFVIGYGTMPDSAGAGGSTTVAKPSWNF